MKQEFLEGLEISIEIDTKFIKIKFRIKKK